MDQVELSEAPQITLGKKLWRVPELAARQNMRIVPKIMAAQKTDFGSLTEDGIKIFYDIGFIALTRANPELTREQFDELPVGLNELLAALPIIARQAGMAVAEVATGGQGEAPAAMAPSTGMPS